jgi:hypothetical protein
MKTLTFTGMAITCLLLSCEKSTELDPQALQLELESCKVNKKHLAVGMEYGGGIIFYLDETGKHGLIAAKEDLGPAPWGCYGTEILMDMSWQGEMFARSILQNCKEPGIAARLCKKYVANDAQSPERKYADWYMPEDTEFGMLVNVLKNKANLVCNREYWMPLQPAHSEVFYVFDPALHAGAYRIVCAQSQDGTIRPYTWYDTYPHKKSDDRYVRPIRKF